MAKEPRRYSKILCTLGPVSSTPEVVGQLIDAGMNAARLNLSHGTHDDHARVYRVVRQEASRRDVAVAILADLQGPKLRIGKIPGEGFALVDGRRVIISTRADDTPEQTEAHTLVTTTYLGMAEAVTAGDRILMDDGNLELSVDAVEDNHVITTVVQGGLLTSNKGINLPGVGLDMPALTDKDKVDLEFALNLGVDAIALSFV
ncbi:MAG: pyruvate kinase, partial [Nannocystaceae bacterium]|nr:pyruvate kinase [Nannocystaceae bacterium]